MASASAESGESLVVGGWTLPADSQSNSDRYLARRLEAAGADFKGVALTNFILATAVGAIAWMATGVLAEHWLVPGGLPRIVRWGWLALGALSFAAAAVRWLVPLIRYRVNLVYAARAIEREHPELHNDLVNTVLVKARPEGSAAVVVRQMEKRAAKRLADVPTEGVMDRTLAVRLAVALAALVALACLYELVAPKSLLVSAARLVAPWAGIAAPSRVRLEAPRLWWRLPGADAQAPDALDDDRRLSVDRGAATLVRGRQVVLGAAIRGLRAGERAVVHAVPLTADGGHDPSSPPWQVEMTRGAAGEEGKAFTAFLPDAVRGLGGSVEVSIVAGDARGEPVRIVVVDAPSLLVREVRYDYPAYLGREPETVAWQGDLRAPEETQVTLVAECNQPIEAAWIDFGCDGQRDLKMRVSPNDLARATITFPLRMNADRSAPEHAAYRLLFQPRSASPSAREEVIVEPMEHRIEVIADLAPEVSIAAPLESPLAVPLDSPVPVEVRALDPDHQLAKVVLEARLDGGSTTTIPILSSPRKGPFKGKGRIHPGKLPGASGGATVQYRAVATDDRPQQPNVTATPWQELKLDAKAPPRPDEREPDLPADSKKPRDGDKPDDDRRGDDGEDMADGGDGGDQSGAGDDARDPDDRRDERGERPQGDRGDDRQQDGDRPQPGERGQERPPRNQQRGDRGDEQSKPESADDSQPPGEQGDQAEGANPQAQKGGGQGTRKEPGDGDKDKTGKQGADGQPQPGAGQQGQEGNRGEGRGDKGEGQAGDSGEKRDDGAGQGERQRGAGRDRDGGDSGAGKRGQRERGEGQRDPVAADGTNDGEAMERILERRRREGRDDKDGKDGKDGDEGEGQKGEGQKGEGQKGEGQKGEGQQGEGQQGEGQKGEGQQGEGQKGEGQKGEGQKGEGQKGEGQKGEGQKGEGQKGEGQKGEGQKGEGQKGEGQKGEGQKGEGQKGEGQKGEGQKGEGQQGEGQQGEGQQGEGQQGEGQQGEGQQGEGQKGEGQQGEGQQGEGQQGEGQKGEGQKGEGQKGEGQKGEGQKGEGQQGEGQKGEGQKGEGQKGEGQKGEGQKGEGQKGEGQKGEGQKGEGQQGEGQQGEGQQGEGAPAEGGEQPGAKGAGKPPAGENQPQGGQPAGGGASEGDQEGGGGAPPDKPAAGRPGTSSSPTGSGGWSNGEGPPPEGGKPLDGDAPTRDAEWGDQDTRHARNAADLAVRTLKDDLAKGRTELLDELGWTRDQARAFLERWEKMKSLEGSTDPVKRGEYDRAVRSLGLRGQGSKTKRDVPADVKGGQAEGRRSRPPSDYLEQFKAYTQGTVAE